nr:Dyp-type peroxidase domain-containing protein [Brevibacterium casei]
MTFQYASPPSAVSPQHVLEPPAPSAVFVVVTVKPGAEDAIREFLGGIGGVIRAVGFRAKAANLSCVTGIGADLWDRLYPEKRPAKLHPFKSCAAAPTSHPRRPVTFSSTSAPSAPT